MRTHIEQEVLSHFGSETNLTSVSEQVGSSRQREKDKKKVMYINNSFRVTLGRFSFINSSFIWFPNTYQLFKVLILESTRTCVRLMYTSWTRYTYTRVKKMYRTSEENNRFRGQWKKQSRQKKEISEATAINYICWRAKRTM